MRQLAGRHWRRDKLVAHLCELLLRHAAGILEFHGEAARLTKSADRGRDQHEDLRITKSAECGGRALHYGVGAILTSLALAVVGKADEGLAGILAAQAPGRRRRR